MNDVENLGVNLYNRQNNSIFAAETRYSYLMCGMCKPKNDYIYKNITLIFKSIIYVVNQFSDW
jgi:hypothetical protein